MSEPNLYDPARHAALSAAPWDPGVARGAIAEIVADAEAAFDAERYWPTHPLDENVPDGTTGLYFGAVGMIWGMQFLRREAGADHGLDFAAQLARLLERNREECAALLPQSGMEPSRVSYLFGDPPILLLMIRAGVGDDPADELYRRIEAGLDLPVLELMWGAAGTMLACVFAHEMTGEDRWRGLFQAQAQRLLGELEETEFGLLWTQDLYGRRGLRALGPVHGYAGNMQALLGGWEWLSEAQQAQIKTAVPATLGANAQRSDLGVNWPPVVGREETRALLVQYCHWAPGMVTALADARIATPGLVSMLEEGARLVGRAGPLAKGSNLCHGTGGNAYAFLKLAALTGDPAWIEPAQAFAMTAIEQYRAAKAEYGRVRFSLWTGDIGLAVFLHECLAGTARFPNVDVF